jgi:uncharacterized repeat protein (TIGR03803 family)
MNVGNWNPQSQWTVGFGLIGGARHGIALQNENCDRVPARDSPPLSAGKSFREMPDVKPQSTPPMRTPLYHSGERFMTIPRKLRVLTGLLGCSIFVFATLSLRAQAQDLETVIHHFNPPANGFNPWGSLAFDSAGNLYGTTFFGGKTSYCVGVSCGLVYKLTPTASGWQSSTIHAFSGAPDGANPMAGLVADAAGNFYGSAQAGGNPAFCQNGLYFGCGTIFKLSSTSNGQWQFSVLYAFTGGVDGANPEGSLAIDSSGNLYGTTEGGLTASLGTVFELSPTSSGRWKLTTLHTFTGGSDGEQPSDGLILSSTGNLYGTTPNGGAQRQGTVYQLTPDSGGRWHYQIIHSFDGVHGATPRCTLAVDPAGNLFGTTSAGGAHNGVVFELSQNLSGSWAETVLYQVRNGEQFGLVGPVALDTTGKLLFTTIATGGAFGQGTVLRLAFSGAGWQPTFLFYFKDFTTGTHPQSGVILDSSGNLYGTAFGFDGSDGAVFELYP